MKLTKKAREELRQTLAKMERARAYIDGERVAVCRRSTLAITTLDYSRASDGAALSEVTKWVGSELCLLDTAIEGLAAFIVRH